MSNLLYYYLKYVRTLCRKIKQKTLGTLSQIFKLHRKPINFWHTFAGSPLRGLG